MSNYLSRIGAEALNNSNPENQNAQLGSKLKWLLGLNNPPGKVFYVSRNILASGNGLSWDQAFKTIGEAVDAANDAYTDARQPDKGRNTVIYVGEGWYSEVPLTLTASDVHIIGVASGSHDSIVLYGSSSQGSWAGPSGGPALTLAGSNNTVMNMGFFTADPLYASVKDGAHASDGDSGYYGTNGNSLINCSFVRDVADGSLGGLDIASNEGPYVSNCRFSTSCKDWGIRIRSNGVTNPVGVRIEDCKFVGTPDGINIVAGSDIFILRNYFIDDMTDRPDACDNQVVNEGNNVIITDNYWEGSEADAITGGGDHLNINNHLLAKT